ncbi:imidazoleglycerol-phosphate dehydratase HisB [bacterium]|nr:imidazoleglycerol-phosphate dehydratase HisB [bacterium]
MIKSTRKTNETDITAELNIYGTGVSNIDTGIKFFDHMLETFSKHSYFDINIKCVGDLEVDFHHTVEDVGIVLGELFARTIYPLKNIERFGSANIVMDESLSSTTLDVIERPFFYYKNNFLFGKIGSFDSELIEEFLKSFIFNAKITAHIVTERGTNKHHISESLFKSLAVALRKAVKVSDSYVIPSTKY